MEKNIKVLCMCELMEAPVGIDRAAPRFSWALPIEAGDQKSYQLIVSAHSDLSNPVWNSGKVYSQETNLVPYKGEKLMSGTTYFYQVQCECENNNFFSEICSFFTGILEERDWENCWVGGSGVRNHSYYIRWPFETNDGKKIVSAAAFVASPNYYQLSCNGREYTETRLNNARTDYGKTILYETYPLKLLPGENVLGIEIGNGWYAMERAERGIAIGEHLVAIQVRIAYEDGTVQWLESIHENCWFSAKCPAIYNSVYSGEVYDARLQQNGWNLPEFLMKKEDGWQRAFQLDSPGGKIKAQMMEPIKVMAELSPVQIYKVENGYTVDFGQNFAGWIRLKVHGMAGDRITMRFAELINENGTVNDCSLNGLKVEDCFILSGDGEECFEPRFTYHGFRYVQITGLRQKPEKSQVTGCVAYSAVKRISSFESDAELLNRFYQAMLWTEKSNLYSVPTDCPQRAERVGWLNDMTVRNECALYNYHLPVLYRKWLKDIRDTQGKATGAISDTAPFARMGQKPADPVSSSFLLVPWNVYCFYGDKEILEENYDACVRWAQYLDRHSENGLVAYSPMGDWASPKKWCDQGSIGAGAVSRITPTVFMAAGYQYYNYVLLKKMAMVLGKEEDIHKFEEKAQNIKEQFCQTYYNEEYGYFAENSQACNSFPLYLEMVDEKNRERVLQNLVQDIMATNHCHLTTGNLCSRYVVETLFQNGYADEALALLLQTSYPSWGYMLENGATTLWERWEMVENYEGVSKMASFNHAMTGAVVLCFHKYLAGLRVDEENPGFKNAIIRPLIPAKLNHIKGSIETVHGILSCEWVKEKENKLRIEVEVPSGCRADVYLPVKKGKFVALYRNGMRMENVCSFWQKREGTFIMQKVKSGRNVFELQY